MTQPVETVGKVVDQAAVAKQRQDLKSLIAQTRKDREIASSQYQEASLRALELRRQAQLADLEAETAWNEIAALTATLQSHVEDYIVGVRSELMDAPVETLEAQPNA